MKISKKYLALGLLGSVLSAGSAYAASENINANINFGTALTLTEVDAMQFGVVTVTTGGTFTINSNTEALTAGGGGEAISGSPAAAEVTIAGQASEAISIQVAFTPSAHVTLTNATCTYAALDNTDCSTAPVASTVHASGTANLRIGATATVNAGAVVGTPETPVLAVTVIYT